MSQAAFELCYRKYHPDSITSSDETNEAITPLYYSAVAQIPKSVEILLNRRAIVNTQGGYFGNALQAASYTGRLEIVNLLLDASADVNTQDGFFGNALHAASYAGH